MARGTDSHLFADLMVGIDKHVALTNDYDKDDPQKFSLATPLHCYSALIRCWSIIPSERVVMDMTDFERVLNRIVDVNGCVIRGDVLRMGRRALKSDGTGTRKSRFSPRDRKDTMLGTPMHPDAQRGFDLILKFADDKYAEFQERMHRIDDEVDQMVQDIEANDVVNEDGDAANDEAVDTEVEVSIFFYKLEVEV
jgi:hypothetical protein